MHDSRRWRLIFYDISMNDEPKKAAKRWRRVYTLLKGYGDSLQYSVFRCRLDDRQTAKLRAELATILIEKDKILLINLCPGCAGQVACTHEDTTWSAPPPTFSVVRSRASKEEPRA